MNWAVQERMKNGPMTSPSELESSALRQPLARARAGESALACLPTSWSASLSRPALSSGLDSREPRWATQTVSTMNRKNRRYSDCQFSARSTANSEEVRYAPMVTSGSQAPAR